jgi:hypothetical protein
MGCAFECINCMGCAFRVGAHSLHMTRGGRWWLFFVAYCTLLCACETSANMKALKSSTPEGTVQRAMAVGLGLPDGVKNGLASGFAAVCVKAVLQPFDTIKTVQQASLHILH